MPLPAKCPRCQSILQFPVLLERDTGDAWVRCGECDLAIIFDQTGVDPVGFAPAARLAAGLTVRGYTLLGVIAVGGMGFLYSAIREQTQQLCALKILPPEFLAYRSIVQRFKREAYAMRALRHPGFMPLLEEFRDHEPPFFTMPFIAGRTLRNLLDERTRLAVDEICAITSQLGDALDHLHQSGFVHRDVKPSNVLLGARGEVILFDFGIVQESGSQSDLTDEGALLGTPAYNAPETFERCEMSSLSDQYSLAVIMYQCLTGMLPMGVFPAPSVIVHDLPPPAEEALMRALAHDPRDRHESVKQFVRAFMRPLLMQSGVSDDQRWTIRVLAEPPQAALAVEPSYEAFPENDQRDIGFGWLLRKLMGK